MWSPRSVSTEPVATLLAQNAEAIELAVTAVQFLVAFVILVALGRWLYRDASSRGSEWAWQWATGIPLVFLASVIAGPIGVLFGILALVIYLQLHPREASGA